MTQAHTDPAASGKETAKVVRMAKPDKQELLDFVLGQLDDDQAQEIVTIDLEGKSSIADYMVIASGRSTRQVASIAQKLAEKLKQNGYGPVKLEGLPQADWVLLDAGDIVVHLFRPEVRSFYNLERMWAFGDAPPVAGTA
ncbi:MAG: ribosome silencing factor [Erythrobacter sp.]|nr:ribosome silencing factor [Erythrobacter sp.]